MGRLALLYASLLYALKLHFGGQCPVQIVGKRQLLFSSMLRESHCCKTGDMYIRIFGD